MNWIVNQYGKLVYCGGCGAPLVCIVAANPDTPNLLLDDKYKPHDPDHCNAATAAQKGEPRT